jgi:Holliday junction resolvase
MDSLEAILDPSSSINQPKKKRLLEKNFYQTIRKNLWRLEKNNWSILKIDTFATRGIPDLLVRDPENNFHFVELKVTQTRKVRLSPHQVSFFVRNKDTRSWIMVQDKAESVYLYKASQILDLQKEGLNEQPLGGFWEAPYVYWQRVFNALSK